MNVTIAQLMGIQPDPVLTGFSLDTSPAGFISDRMFPNAIPGPSTVKIYDFGMQGLKPILGTLVKSASGEIATFGIDMPTTATFEVEPHAMQTPLDKFSEAKAAEAASGAINLERLQTTILTNQWNTTKELIAAALLASSAVFDGANSATLSGSAQWSHADSDPVKAVLDAKLAIAKKCGYMPNKMQISMDILHRLKLHPKIMASLPSTQSGPATLAQLVSIFELEEIIVSSALQNSAGKGGVNSLDFLWAKAEAILFYQSPIIGEGIRTFSANFQWAGWVGMQMFRYQGNNPLKSFIMLVECMRYAVVDRLCAYKFKGVLA